MASIAGDDVHALVVIDDGNLMCNENFNDVLHDFVILLYKQTKLALYAS